MVYIWYIYMYIYTIYNIHIYIHTNLSQIHSYLSIFPLHPLSHRANFELGPSSVATLTFRIYFLRFSFFIYTVAVNIILV